tara:strand:- start:197 stop:337 length:141 start_codon:yes stop_codon:yes gene_type:complete
MDGPVALARAGASGGGSGGSSGAQRRAATLLLSLAPARLAPLQESR